MVIVAHDKDNRGSVYGFMLQGETWTEDKILTASDAEFNDHCKESVSVSRDNMLVGAPYKDVSMGGLCVCPRRIRIVG